MQDSVVWFEVVRKDGGALRRFYSDLFGWKIDPGAYLKAEEAGRGNGRAAALPIFRDPQGHLIGLSKRGPVTGGRLMGAPAVAAGALFPALDELSTQGGMRR